ncbi:arginase [Bacteroidia bacterium]|nr:arginase [Bacteroidia bacterium]
MDISTFLEPSSFSDTSLSADTDTHRITVYTEIGKFPDLTHTDIAIVGVPETRYAEGNVYTHNAPDVIREHFYNLCQHTPSVHIADIGNIVIGRRPNDTYAALSEVMVYLFELNIIPLVLGGSQDLTYAMYKAYAKRKQVMNLMLLDANIDLGDPEQGITSRSYLSKIIVDHPNYLFFLAQAGFQTYLTDAQALQLLENLSFEVYRLGAIRKDLTAFEPVIRGVDALSIDMSVVRYSDSPGHENSQPVGLFGEEICQLVRYAGTNENLSSIGFFEYNPQYDNNGQSAQLIAIMMWYFIDGYSNRKHEYPHLNKDNLTKYIVTIADSDENLVFYKSKISDRWWVEVPSHKPHHNTQNHRYIIPCSYADYETAMRNQIPERWLLAFRRLA